MNEDRDQAGTLPQIDPRLANDWFVWLPIPVLLTMMVILWATDSPVTYEAPVLVMLLNFATRTLASLFIIYLTTRAFLASGSPSLLLLGCGMAIWAAAGSISSALVAREPNLSITISNLGTWLSALCHLAGSALLMRPDRTLRPAGPWLAVGYGSALGAVVLITSATFAGRLPVFFVQGQGGTLVRHLVLGSSIAMFTLAVLMLRGARRSAPEFAKWYASALLMIGLALFGLMLATSRNGLLDWACRIAQYLGGVYLFLAAFAARRQPRSTLLFLKEAANGTRNPYGVAVVLVAAAVVARLTFLKSLGQFAPFLLFYPAVALAALYGGLRAGLLASILSALLTDYFWLEPVGALSVRNPAEAFGLVFFFLSTVMISFVAEAMQRAKTRAAKAEEQARHAVAKAQMEQALRESEERFRPVFEGMLESFLIQEILRDEQGRLIDLRFLEVNPVFERQLGKTRAEIIGHTRSEVLGPLDSEAAAFIDQAVSGSRPARMERYLPATGRWYEVLSYSPRPDQLVTLNLDITERKQAEEALRHSEDRYHTLFSTLIEGFCIIEVIFDPENHSIDYRFLEVNPAFERQTGLHGAQGKLISEVVPDNEAYWFDIYGTVALTGQPARFENEVKALKRWFEVFAYRVGPPDSRKVAILFTDITERKRAERALRVLNESLEQRVAERTAESRRLADQLRALASELSQAEQRERKRLAAILHDHLQQLLVGAKMRLGLIRSADQNAFASKMQGLEAILDEAIAASRSLTVELSPPVLHQAGLAPGLDWLAARMAEKNLFQVQVHADPEAEPGLEAVRLLLFESVRELLLNAVKYSGVGEAAVTMTRTPEGWTRLVIEDRGRGLDLNELKTRKDPGLGLFSIQQRLTYLGGRMEIESAPGMGMRVILLAPPETAPAPVRSTAEAKVDGRAIDALPRTEGAKVRVLVVDDHQIVRQGLSGLLQTKADLEVVGEAQGGLEALDLARRLGPDVVVTDISMPGMDGVELTRILRRELPAIKVLGLSMHCEEAVAAAMREAGAEGYLTKGGPSEDLIAAIRGCVARPSTTRLS